jgi:PadR family transcriptional regulator, regulatory protein PadR
LSSRSLPRYARRRLSETRPTNDVLSGTLDLLILKALSRDSLHGYGIAAWIQQATDDILTVGEGTLYSALRRLEDRELIAADWGVSEKNRRAKFYSLTTAGRQALRRDLAAWTEYARAILSALAAPAR